MAIGFTEYVSYYRLDLKVTVVRPAPRNLRLT